MAWMNSRAVCQTELPLFHPTVETRCLLLMYTAVPGKEAAHQWGPPCALMDREGPVGVHLLHLRLHEWTSDAVLPLRDLADPEQSCLSTKGKRKPGHLSLLFRAPPCNGSLHASPTLFHAV
ncbi:hypothetical protein H920_16205 [Fukomys damarensis]|uniref:Uncharacterized protein n=1 Tax=Fukomys damarensis TaxID=885580 RepID=A0A091DHV9_FUKDA|nr:hypothetical protein H920_16205 [Fukomys damarensis]